MDDCQVGGESPIVAKNTENLGMLWRKLSSVSGERRVLLRLTGGQSPTAD